MQILPSECWDLYYGFSEAEYRSSISESLTSESCSLAQAIAGLSQL